MGVVPGRQGYAEAAPELVERYDALSSATIYAGLAHILPAPPADILDIGAGTGRDAAWFAEMGHRVLAVEPVDELREPGRHRHRCERITWTKDHLPSLLEVRALDRRFDLVWLSAVWMHLDEAERIAAMATIAALLARRGTIFLSLRHGPVPGSRRMFNVSAQETIGLARQVGLASVYCDTVPSIQPSNQVAGVTWTRLALRWPQGPA